MKRSYATSSETRIRVADEVWIVVALLHREHPERSDFTVEEIMNRAEGEKISGSVRPGIYVHVIQHCVANREPNPGRYRMLFETSRGRRRLFRSGDAYHAKREGAKVSPHAEELPPEYRELLNWYREWCSTAASGAVKSDPLLALRGSGKHLWADEAPDAYVRRLREGWQ